MRLGDSSRGVAHRVFGKQIAAQLRAITDLRRDRGTPTWQNVGAACTVARSGGLCTALNNQLRIFIDFPIADVNSEGFSGVMYLDDVQISPP